MTAMRARMVQATFSHERSAVDPGMIASRYGFGRVRRMIRFSFGLVLLALATGCEDKGACDAPQASACADNVAKSACAPQGPNREVRRFSKGKTCHDLGYGEADAGSHRQRNEQLGFSIDAPLDATFVTSSDTEIIRWVLPQADGPFPVLCAITIVGKDAHPKSLADAKATFEKSGAFKAASATEANGGYALNGVKVTDPKITQYVTRRIGTTKSGEATCTGPTDHAQQLAAVVGSLRVD